MIISMESSLISVLPSTFNLELETWNALQLVGRSRVRTISEAWNTLAEMYQPKGPIAIVLAQRKLFHAKCQEGAEIEEHIRTLTHYRQQLHALGLKLSEDEFAITILTSLPDSWNSFIQGVDTTALSNNHAIKMPNLILTMLLWQPQNLNRNLAASDVVGKATSSSAQ